MSAKKTGRTLGDVQPVEGLDVSALRRQAQPLSAPAVAPTPAEDLKEQLRTAGAGFVSTRTTMPATKLVKDAFAMPEDDYALIGKAMQRALDHRRAVKKVAVVRAALRALDSLDDAEFLRLIDSIPDLKPGPKK